MGMLAGLKSLSFLVASVKLWVYAAAAIKLSSVDIGLPVFSAFPCKTPQFSQTIRSSVRIRSSYSTIREFNQRVNRSFLIEFGSFANPFLISPIVMAHKNKSSEGRALNQSTTNLSGAGFTNSEITQVSNRYLTVQCPWDNPFAAQPENLHPWSGNSVKTP